MEGKLITADKVARMAQVLAHPVRLEILELLREEGAYVMHLTSMLDRPQANISQHLAVLRDAGLVSDEREGMTVVYRVRDRRIFEVIEQLASLASQGSPGADEWAMGRRRQGFGGGRGHGRGGNCRCPRCRGE